MSTENIKSLDGSSYEAIHSSVSQNIFSSVFSSLEQLLQLKITKKNEYN